MIQRIQSVYLFIAFIIMSLLFLRSIVLIKISGIIPEQQEMLLYLDDDILDIYDHGILLAFTSLTAIISLITIFLYRKRDLQILLTRGSMLIAFFFLIFTIYLTYSDLKPFYTSIRITPALGLFLPFVTIIFLILAVQGIKKDNKLVRSMDRLR